ncbi:MAG: phosphatidate cytidylyltransferase [Holosporales bacterium]|jgi:phosphatidate cytidylyltransferase|nr:phosphatidate cytidylyltransferase [Holosporales bacterium]
MEGEVIKRVASAICIVTIIIVALVLGKLWIQLLIAVFLGLMLYEWAVMNIRAFGDIDATGASMRAASRLLLLLVGIAYIASPMLYWIHALGHTDRYDVVWCMAVVSACDVAAYFGGRLFGGPKLVPNISKNKTWSGAVSGFMAGFVASYVFAAHLVSINAGVLLCSVIMPLAAIFGDLLESKTKRMLNVKDSGGIIPGHGGVCDRLDSFLLVSYVVMLLRVLGS